MSEKRLRALLEELGLGEYFDALAAERIAPEDLALLSERDLVALGLPLGPRRRLMQSVAAGSPGLSHLVGERRNLTVLFSDMVDSTVSASQLDPEDLRARFGAYRQACAAAIEAEGGYVAHQSGDGLMAHFGYPCAMEDAAIRAVRAALDLVDRMAGLAAPGGPIAVRVGIATGLTVIEEARSGLGVQDVATGATLPRAARLQALAEPGQILVSDATRRLLRNAFDLAPLGRKRLKGFAEAEPAWQVKGRAPASPQFRKAEAPPTRLLGRDAEFAHLLSAWRDCLGGTGGAIVVEGEAGIGKTRLVVEVRDAAMPDGDVLTLRCSGHRHGAALHPVTDWVNAMMAQDGGPEPQTRLSDLTGAPSECLSPLARIIGQGTEAPDGTADPLDAQNEIIDAVIALLSSPAGRARMLIFEDVHWADHATREVLSRIADRTREAPLLVVATTRPEGASLSWRAGYRKVALGPLHRDATMELIDALSAPDGLPDAARRTVTERSAGIPFFVEELTRAMSEAGSGNTTAVPITLQDTLMARLDRLGSGKSVAQMGAVIGRSFSLGLLAACSHLPEALLRAGLSELVAGNLLQPEPGEHEQYTFRHALVRDVAYGSLLHASRIALHGRVAKTYETHFPGLAAAQPETVAHHYTEADQPAAAALYWERAAELAVSQAAPEAAIGYFNRALDMLKRLPASAARDDQEARLRIRLNMPLTVTTGFASDETEQNVARLAEILKVAEPSEGALQLLWSRCMAALVRADLSTAKTTAFSMRRAVGRSDLPNVTRMPERILGYVAMLEGHLDAAESHFGRVLTGYAPAALDPILPGHPFDVLASSLSQRAILMALRDRPALVDHDQARALARAHQLDSPATLFQVLVHLCIARLELGDHDAVRPLLKELRELMDRDEIAPLYVELWEAWLQARDGALEEGLTGMALAQEKGTQYPLWTPRALLMRADLLAAADRHDEALAVLDTCDAEIARLRHTYLRADAIRRRAACLAALGASHAEIDALLSDALATAAKQGATRFQRAVARDLDRHRSRRPEAG